MKNNNKWFPVTVPFDGNLYENFTLVKCSGWRRLGFAIHFKGINTEGWSLSHDPSIERGIVTHWLAIPLMKEKRKPLRDSMGRFLPRNHNN